MSAYLYTYNPKLWDWYDLQNAIYSIDNDETYERYWSCGNTKRIEIGDIFLLMRLGVEPKGIIGCGYILSKPYLLPHWQVEKANEGQEALRTDLLFKALSEDPILGLHELKKEYPNVKWTPQSSGQSVPEDIANQIFTQIQNKTQFRFSSMKKQEIATYAEGKPKLVTNKTYDRSSNARDACIGHYKYICNVCGFNFEATYGDLGRHYIEVHHLKQLADIGEEYLVDPIQDLRPVCANCHRMLHKTRPSKSIEELRKYVEKAKVNIR